MPLSALTPVLERAVARLGGELMVEGWKKSEMYRCSGKKTNSFTKW